MSFWSHFFLPSQELYSYSYFLSVLYHQLSTFFSTVYTSMLASSYTTNLKERKKNKTLTMQHYSNNSSTMRSSPLHKRITVHFIFPISTNQILGLFPDLGFYGGFSDFFFSLFNFITVAPFIHIISMHPLYIFFVCFLIFMFFHFPMSGVLVSVTQNGRENWNCNERRLFLFFFSFPLTNKQNYRCTQPRTCINSSWEI